MNTGLRPDEKRIILEQYAALRAAIDGGMAEDDVAARAVAFQQAYVGESRPLVDAFGAADDKGDWARQVGVRLAEEIEPEWWPPPTVADTHDALSENAASAAAPTPDDLVAVPLECEHCGDRFEAHCALMGVVMSGTMPVTDHALACPTCGRIGEHALPGPVVEVVSRARLQDSVDASLGRSDLL